MIDSMGDALFRIGLRLSTADLAALTPDERAFACLDQVADGTDLYQFYYWGAGRGAAELPWAARHVGAPELGALFEQANGLFPPGVVRSNLSGPGPSEYLDDHDIDFTAIEDRFGELNREGKGLRTVLGDFAMRHSDVFPETQEHMTFTNTD
jgi:hypothetical protein